MAINLNNDNFDSKEFIIFGGGKPGIVENVALSVKKKNPETDKPNAPDYQLVYTDTNKGTTNTSFWYIKENIGDWTVDQQIESQGTILKHILKTIYGADFQIPSFEDEKDLLNKSMKLIHEGCKSNPLVRIFANYGTMKKPSQYIGCRTWAPFMESMSVSLEDTTLKVSGSDRMEPLKEDRPKMGDKTSGSEAGSQNADEDW